MSNIKMIHCADIHLDSSMHTHLNRGQAKERKGELMHTFLDMVRYAAEEQVTAILIAGDLFDTGKVSGTTRNLLLDCMRRNPEIGFYYLRGNHDADPFHFADGNLPENLHLFQKEWTTCTEADGSILISGLELNGTNAPLLKAVPEKNPEQTHIVLLHGQISETESEEGAVIPLKSLRDKGIDYLALGHLHSYQTAPLDAEGTLCYPGCLEGRGFDECGEHGFVLLEIDTAQHILDYRFIPFAKRRVCSLEADISGSRNTAEILFRVEQTMLQSDCTEKDYVEVQLTGALDITCEKNLTYIEAAEKQKFYCFHVVDKTTLSLHTEDYRYDESLKGYFIRQVLEDGTLSPEEQTQIARIGLQAIFGEAFDDFTLESEMQSEGGSR